MTTDCHLHVNWLGYDADRIVAHMDELGIDTAWLLTWELVDGLTPTYLHLSAADMWRACEKHPGRFVPFYAPDPRRADAARVLREAIERGLKGFGECKVPICLDDPHLLRLFHICEEHGLPVLLHLGKAHAPDYEFWWCYDINALDRVLAMFPGLAFVGHGPGFWRYISGDEADGPKYPWKRPVTPGGQVPELLRRHVNLYCDISAHSGLAALSRDAEFTRGFITEFADRILYGTDMYTREHLDFLAALDLDDATRAKIMGENAAKLTNA